MKKEYIKPQATEYSVTTSAILAGSLDVNNTPGVIQGDSKAADAWEDEGYEDEDY